MTNKQYESFENKKVGVITLGRKYNGSNNESLTLEGKLYKETEEDIFLKDVSCDAPDYRGTIKTNLMAISKDKIIALYLKE